MLQKGKYDKLLERIDLGAQDIQKREIINGRERIIFLFVKQLCDVTFLMNELINPINVYILKNNGEEIYNKYIYDLIISNFEFQLDEDEEKIIDYVTRGLVVGIIADLNKYFVLNIRKNQKRNIGNPELTYTLRGPRDCFNENLDDNLSLIRYRVKDSKLTFNNYEVGKRTKTRVSIIYISDIANERIVSKLIKRIEDINVDGIVSSGELQKLLLNKKTDLLPQIGIAERSDMAAGALLEGKIIVLVEGCFLALIVPKIFNEFFTSGDDIYDNKFFALFMKFIRIVSTSLSVVITSLYVAIIGFHIDTLPVEFILSISNSSQGVPFTAFIGAIILELIVEMLREALIRIPKEIGPAVGIVGGIVIGQAAIAAKIFNPLLLIVVSISLLSSFTVPDYTIMNALRLIKYFLIFSSALFGLIGFTLAISIILVNICSNNSFGVPYFAPFAPFNWYDFKNYFYYGKGISPFRPNFLSNKDNTRSKQ